MHQMMQTISNRLKHEHKPNHEPKKVSDTTDLSLLDKNRYSYREFKNIIDPLCKHATDYFTLMPYNS